MGFESLTPAALAWLAFAATALIGPGIALQRSARVPVDPALAIPLGAAFCAAAFWLSQAVGLPAVFPALVLLANLPLAAGRPWTWAPGPTLRGAVAPFAAHVAVLTLTQYQFGRLDSTGSFLLDPLLPFDTAFHVGLARELSQGYPPQLPGVAGLPIGYHLGIDLVRAAAFRWAAVNPFDSISRFDVTLYALGLILVLRAAAARMGATRLAVTLVPWTLLATDFSFLFGALPSAHWWVDLFRGNLLMSLVQANPVVPALSLALAALLGLSRRESGEGRGYLLLAAAMAVAVPFFKVFLGAHLALGLAGAVLVGWRRGKDGTMPAVVVAGASAVATAVLALGQGGRTLDVSLAPLDLATATRATLELPPVSGTGLLLWATVWLITSLGLRLFGLAPAFAACRADTTLARALGIMALAAWPLGLLFRVAASEVLPGQKFVNDAGSLLEQGGPLLWIFTVLGLVALAGRARPVLITVAAVLALPTTVQFMVKKSMDPPDPMPASIVRAMRALETVSNPGDVVLQRPGARFPPAPVILIGRRVPYERFTPYLTQFAPRAVLEERHDALHRFFQTADRHEALAIARGFGARFLVLYDRDRVRFDTAGALLPIYEEAAARVYRLSFESEAQ